MQIAGFALAIPSVLILIASMILAWVISKRSQFYRDLVDNEIAGKRFHSIDGLRGYLALFVAFSHLAVNHQFYATGKWQATPSALATFFGSGGVAFFFMITAFLFWNRIAYDGTAFDAVKFLHARVRRLLPMYLISSVLVVLTAFALTHFRLNTSAPELAKQIASWLLFTAPGNPDINGFYRTYIINGVFWTLVYEWKFYIILPLIAACMRTKLRPLLVPAICACIYLYAYPPIEWLFVAGAAAAAVVRIKAVRSFASSSWFSIPAIATIAIAIRIMPQPYNATGAAILFLPFLAIASGNTIFGLLKLRAARFLGTISYSFYLLHSWVLYLTYRAISHFTDVAALSISEYWIVGLSVILASIALSAYTFRAVEFRFMRHSMSKNISEHRTNAQQNQALTGAGK